MSDTLRVRIAEPAEHSPAHHPIGTAVLGAGPAGLTAAYVLALRGHQATGALAVPDRDAEGR